MFVITVQSSQEVPRLSFPTTLNRRVSGLEEDLEKTAGKMVATVAKLDKAGTAADDSERAKKVFQSKADEDEKRISAH